MQETQVVFRCPICRLAITRPLLALKPDQSVHLDPGQPAVPEGYFGINEREYWSAAGGVLVNLADLINTKHHPDHRRLNGCCGLDGCDGPNLVCLEGHEAGTEKSDCWMPHAAVLFSERGACR
jgi:hypothetical protein